MAQDPQRTGDASAFPESNEIDASRMSDSVKSRLLRAIADDLDQRASGTFTPERMATYFGCYGKE